MKTIIYILFGTFLLIGCRKDDDDHKLNTYTIEGRYLKDCSTPWVGVNLRFRTIRFYTFSIKEAVVAEVITDENGYYKAAYQDKNERFGKNGKLQIDYALLENPTKYYPLLEDYRLLQNLKLDYVTRPNDTAFFRTIGGNNLSSSDTLYFDHDTRFLHDVVGPIDDNIPFDTIVYRSNTGRQAIYWSVGRENIKTLREYGNYGNYGSWRYERNICSSTEIIIDLTNFKK